MKLHPALLLFLLSHKRSSQSLLSVFHSCLFLPCNIIIIITPLPQQVLQHKVAQLVGLYHAEVINRGNAGGALSLVGRRRMDLVYAAKT